MLNSSNQTNTFLNIILTFRLQALGRSLEKKPNQITIPSL